MRQRFGPRLEVRLDIDPAAIDTPVPRFLLQPLVENAIRHGVAARAGTGTVEIAVTREADATRLEVRDNGRGLGSSRAPGNGIGLADTASRLALLYGDRHRFEVTPRPGGGTIARVDIPLDGRA
jgi:LytS/YehU family sensor histidine kinase